MKFMSEDEIQCLSDKELDDYANSMTMYQLELIALMDIWVDYYNIASDEYDRRKPNSKRTVIDNDSTTKH